MIFNKSFKEEESSNFSKDFLISGLFTALSQLVQETLGDKLKELILQNKKIFFTFRESYFIVLVASYEIETDVAKQIIKEIDEEFGKRFNLEDFKGRIDIFRDFDPIIEKIIERNKTPEMKLVDKYENMIRAEIDKFSKIDGETS